MIKIFIGSIVCLFLAQVCIGQQKTGIESFSVGVIADCQYCSDPGEGVRKYAASEAKLKLCVDHFNTMELEYVIHLGDFIDRDFESFNVVKPIYKQLSIPGYHVLGNHDFSVSDSLKKEIPQTLGLPSRYYDYEVKGWRFVVLDGNDISFHAYPVNSAEYKEAAKYYEDHQISFPKWNGAIGPKQLFWLDNVLKKATIAGENVILYCHFPVFPEDNNHNLWNSHEVLEILEAHPSVKVYINGHNHAGNYAVKEGIHYLTLKGMVDTEETSYAVIEVKKDSVKVQGFGREESRILELRE